MDRELAEVKYIDYHNDKFTEWQTTGTANAHPWHTEKIVPINEWHWLMQVLGLAKKERVVFDD